jgi:histidyl-tRNA synthetase
MNDHSRQFFADVCAGLDSLGIAHHINPKLVRGLDYYTHTAFEFITESLGAQGAVIAGGRYDGLIETMGGPPTPGIGWAGGIERLSLLIDEPPPARRPVCLVPLGDAAEARAIALCGELRHAGYRAEMSFRGNLSRRMKAANKLGAAAVVMLGDDELAKGVGTVRDLDSGEQREVPLDKLVTDLDPYR